MLTLPPKGERAAGHTIHALFQKTNHDGVRGIIMFTIDLNTVDEKQMELFYEVLNTCKFDVSFNHRPRKNHYELISNHSKLYDTSDIEVLRLIAQGFGLNPF